MNEKDLEQNIPSNHPESVESEILVNDYGSTRDPAVVVDEMNRTILLTENETIVIEKEPLIDIVPKNRPRKVYGGMWGQAEIVTAGLALLAVLTVILLYIFLVVPSNRELEKNRTERDRLERELVSARAKYGDITSTETQVAKLISSVDDFESRYLPPASTGRTALYQRMNGLIAGYGLINTSGPDFAPLEIADRDQQNQSDEERGRARFRSLFPGVYVTTTVEGSYQNLRRFIREIETGNEFVVISAVELEPSDSEQEREQGTSPVWMSNTPPANSTFNDPEVMQPLTRNPQPPRARGKTHGEIVRLRLEMAAYFRRPNMKAVVTESQ